MRDPLQTSTETEKGSSRIPFSQQAWTLDTLKVHFDSRIEDLRRYFSDLAQTQEQTNRDRFTAAEKGVATAFTAADKAVQAAMAASEKAVLKAENAAEKRAEASNEIRAAMIDQQSKFADKNATETQFDAHATRITELKEALTARLDKIDLLLATGTAKDEGKGAAMSQTTALIFALLGAAGVIATVAINAFR
jgi:hypothetical protein